MNTPKLPLLLLLLTMMGACATPLRAPLCQEGEFEFPEGAAGRYRLAMPQNSVRWSGALAEIDEIEFEIREGSATYALETTKGALDSVTKAATRINRTPKLQGSLDGSDDDSDSSGDDPAPGDTQAVLPLSVCKIGDAFYSQTDEGDGTWSIARFDLSATGITTVGLSFVPEELLAAGFRYALVPKFEDLGKRGDWYFDSMEPLQLIVDTRSLSPEARERLVAMGHPTGFGMVFSRVTIPKEDRESSATRRRPRSRSHSVTLTLKRP